MQISPARTDRVVESNNVSTLMVVTIVIEITISIKSWPRVSLLKIESMPLYVCILSFLLVCDILKEFCWKQIVYLCVGKKIPNNLMQGPRSHYKLSRGTVAISNPTISFAKTSICGGKGT